MKVQPENAVPELKIVRGTGKYSDLTDVELVQACQMNNEQAFNTLVQRHKRLISSLIFQLAPDWQNQHDDMAQEVYIKMWRSIGGLRNPKAFKAWIKQLITNLFYDLLRKRPRQSVLSLDEPLPGDDGEQRAGRDVADTRSGPEEWMERNDIVQQVNAAIETLPSSFKNVLVLREMHGMQYGEIATITNTEIGTVKSRIARARTKIQSQLNHLRIA